MPSSKIFSKSFDCDGVYPCPVCRVGKIYLMPLMETMACDFCQEIFTVDTQQQQIKMPSRQPPLLWRWNGFNWREAQLEGMELGWGYGIGAIAFVLFPTTLIGIAAFYFPPSLNSPLTWIPYIWTILTFLSHSSIILWIIVEVYQIPLAAYFRAINRWRNQEIGR